MSAQRLSRQTLEAQIGLTPGALILAELNSPTDASEPLLTEETLGCSLALLHSLLPPEALLARHGGAIASIWIPRATAEIAREHFDRWKQSVDVSLSAGMSIASGGEDPPVLLDRADRALSRAREEGGWALWDPEQDPGRRRADPLAGIFAAEPARTYRNVRSLLEAIEEVALAVDLHAMLPKALSRMVEVAGAERGMILLARKDNTFETAVAQDRHGNPIELADDRSRSIPQRVLENGVSVCLTQTEQAAGTEILPGSLATHALRTVLCVPLEAGGRRIGVVYADGRVHSDMVGTEHLSFLEAMARQLAAAIESARISEERRLKIEEEVKALRAVQGGQGLLGEHPRMRHLLEQVARIAPRSLNVLILGPTGSGKESVARAIHAASAATTGPFHVLDCGALSGQLLESEIFGHEKGAFTGAMDSRPGIFEQADGGTLLLDEVAILPPPAQTHLLRVLEEKTIRRMGGSESIHVDVRILASTSDDLRAAVATGRFREDLLYRLAAVEIELPPLARRGDDVLLLTGHFLRLFGEERPLSNEARQSLLLHDWPGNVRELRHRLLRASTLSDGPVLTAADLDLGIEKEPGSDLRTARDLARQVVDEEFLRKALARYQGNVTRAAETLGLSRARLYQMMKTLQIEADVYRI